jgi:hypothetical protein
LVNFSQVSTTLVVCLFLYPIIIHDSDKKKEELISTPAAGRTFILPSFIDSHIIDARPAGGWREQKKIY